MQKVVDGLVERGADLVVILCGADWSPVTSSVPVVNPGVLFPNLVQALGTGLKLGVIKPDEGADPAYRPALHVDRSRPDRDAASPYEADRLDRARRAADCCATRGPS